MAHKISRIELFPLHVPFKSSVQQAMAGPGTSVGMAIKVDEAWNGGDFVLCKLTTDGGDVGWGEAFVWLPETGVNPFQIIEIVQKALGKYVLGADPFDAEKILLKMNHNVARNEVAKGLIDMAFYDLMGKIKSVPARDLMGPERCDSVPLAALVPLGEVETMVLYAKEFYRMGFKTIRLKLGRSVEDDVAITRAVRDVLGSGARLRVDYNQAYERPPDAIRAINAITPFNIDVAEQPVDKDDYLGMKEVQARVSVPLMAHEGCFSFRDFATLAELKAVKVLGLNSERPGGVTMALKAMNHAKALGMGTVIHNQPLGIASAMHLHLAAARYHDLGHDVELFGHVMLEDDLIVKPLKYNKGVGRVPEGSGWGIEVDEAALAKYSVGAAVALKA